MRVDDSHSNHGWNWVRGRFLSVDKGTTRELIGAHIFKMRTARPTRAGNRRIFARRPRSGPGKPDLRFDPEKNQQELE